MTQPKKEEDAAREAQPTAEDFARWAAAAPEDVFAQVIERARLRRGIRPRAIRCRLPDERDSVTHHFVICANVGDEVQEVDGYLTVGKYEDGAPGEIFIRMGKEHGSSIQGFADSWALAFSMALQDGHPLDHLCQKFRRVSFQPAGRTNNPDIPFCTSLPDYVCAWIESRFVEKGKEEEVL